MRRAVATRRLASTLHVWVLGVTAAALIVAAAWMDWLLGTTDAPTLGRLAAGIGAGVAASVARIRVRVGSNGVSFEWGECALLLELALLPNTWTPPVLAGTFLVANLITSGRQPLKVVYNASMWFLASAAAVGVAERIPGSDVFRPWGGLAAVAAAATFLLTTRTLTSAVVAIAARQRFPQGFAAGFRLSLIVGGGNIAAAFLVLALARWSPWSLVMLPPLLLAAHVTYRGTARAQKERDAWR